MFRPISSNYIDWCTMQIFYRTTIFVLLLSLVACSTPATSNTSETLSPTQAETVYQDNSLGLSLSYPGSWEASQGGFSGLDGFFRLSTLSSGGLELEVLAHDQAAQTSQPFGSNPNLESVQVAGQPAYLIIPSDDQPKAASSDSAWGVLVVAFPRPVLYEGNLADFLLLQADLDHLEALSDSLSFSIRPEVYLADSDTPAAGICAQTDEHVVTLEINPDMPSPRCMQVTADQVLRLVNQTGIPLQLRLAWYEFSLEAGAALELNVPLGAYLAPGVHHLDTQGAGSAPEIWVLQDGM